MDNNGQDEPQRVGDDVAFAAFDELTPVEAPSRPRDVAGLNRLTVDHRRRGTGPAARHDPDSSAQPVIELFE